MNLQLKNKIINNMIDSKINRIEILFHQMIRWNQIILKIIRSHINNQYSNRIKIILKMVNLKILNVLKKKLNIFIITKIIINQIHKTIKCHQLEEILEIHWKNYK